MAKRTRPYIHDYLKIYTFSSRLHYIILHFSINKLVVVEEWELKIDLKITGMEES